MNRIVAASRYLALIGVLFGLVATLAAFGWGGYKTVALVIHLVQGEMTGMAVALVQVMDAFLIAAGLLIFSLGLYELFVGHTELPEWLVIQDLDALKSKLAGIVVLVMAVSFLERLETHEDARDIFYTGIGVAVVSAAMIWLGASKRKT
ncbi:MAG: putative rane protein YqhA [Myxococcales bacterium]|nr:putative rane protein YqhA [Myxococcales bacterium]